MLVPDVPQSTMVSTAKLSSFCILEIVRFLKILNVKSDNESRFYVFNRVLSQHYPKFKSNSFKNTGYAEVLQVLCCCLRLPRHHSDASFAGENSDADLLNQQIDGFFVMYEHNVTQYRLPPKLWGSAKRLLSLRNFYILVAKGQYDGALELFDKEKFLSLQGGQDIEDDFVHEYSRIAS